MRTECSICNISGSVPGWVCHQCSVYNGFQRITCKQCNHPRCGKPAKARVLSELLSPGEYIAESDKIVKELGNA